MIRLLLHVLDSGVIGKIGNFCQPDSVAYHRDHEYTVGDFALDAISNTGVLRCTRTTNREIATLGRLNCHGVEREQQIQYQRGYSDNSNRHFAPVVEIPSSIYNIETVSLHQQTVRSIQ